MASRGLMLSFLKNSIQHNLRSQPAVKGLVVRNSPCIANVVYRKLSSSLVRKGDAEKVELRTQEEITKYVKEETDKVNFSCKVSSYVHSFMISLADRSRCISYLTFSELGRLWSISLGQI